MKKIAIISFMLLITVVACKKTGSEINKEELIGSWHLYAFGDILKPPLTPTYNNTLTFKTFEKYEIDSNSIVIETGIYALSVQNNGGGNDTIINFSPKTGEDYQSQMMMRNTTLTLIPYILTTDGYFYSYSRQ